MFATLILALALGAGPAETSSAPELRFFDLLAETLKRNPDLRAYETEAQAALERAEARAAFPDPELGFAVHDLPVPSFSFREDMMTMSEAMVSQRFPWFGKRALRRESGGKGADAIAATQAAHALSLAESLAEAYAELWRIEGKRRLLVAQQATLERLIKLAGQGLSVGASRQADLHLAEAEAAAFGQRLAALDAEETRARAALGALLAKGGPLVGSAEDPPALDLPPLDRLLADLDRHPELVAFDHRREALELEAELARKEKMPDPELSLSYGVRFDQPDMVGVGVRFAIPVFGASRADRLAAAAHGEAQSIERRMEGRREALASALHAAHARARAEAERERLYEEEVLPRLRQSARALTAAYVAGQGNLFAVLDQERRIFTQELERLDARAEAFVARVRLAVGAGSLDLLQPNSGVGEE